MINSESQKAASNGMMDPQPKWLQNGPTRQPPGFYEYKRKRNFVNRVRTACMTCKIRKIKCDETRPSCLKCTSTGRRCDGYPRNAQTACDDPKKGITSRKAPHGIPWSAAEHSLFHLLCTFTRATNSVSWFEHILPLSSDYPVIWFGITAVASSLQSYLAPSEANSRTTAGLYHRAMTELRKLDPKHLGQVDKAVVFASTRLFTTVCNLQGDAMAGFVHVQYAERLVTEWASAPTSEPDNNSAHANSTTSLKVMMTKYMGKNFQVGLVSGPRGSSDHETPKSEKRPKDRPFSGIHEAHVELNDIFARLIDTRAKAGPDFLGSESPMSFRQDLESWDSQFTDFLSTASGINTAPNRSAQVRALRIRRVLVDVVAKFDPSPDGKTSTLTSKISDLDSLSAENRAIMVKEGVTHTDNPALFFATCLISALVNTPQAFRDARTRANIIYQYALKGRQIEIMMGRSVAS